MYIEWSYWSYFLGRFYGIDKFLDFLSLYLENFWMLTAIIWNLQKTLEAKFVHIFNFFWFRITLRGKGKEDLPWRDNWRVPPYHMIIHALQTRYSIWKRVYLKVVFKFFKCVIYYIIMKKSIFYDIKKYVCIANIFASPKNVFVWRYSAYFSPRLMYTITYSEYMYAVFVHHVFRIGYCIH